MEKPCKVYIIEDDSIITQYLKDTLNEFSLVSEHDFSSGEAALDYFNTTNHSENVILLCDVQLSGKMNGIDLCKILNQQLNCKIIFISGKTDADFLHEASNLRANYLVKPVLKSQIKVTLKMALNELSAPSTSCLNLSNREQEIVTLIAKGHSSIEISNQLFVSLETIRSHRKNILRKNNVKNFVELVQLLNS